MHCIHIEVEIADLLCPRGVAWLQLAGDNINRLTVCKKATGIPLSILMARAVSKSSSLKQCSIVEARKAV